MSAAFVLTRRAEQDLDDIWEYIARDSPQAADKVLNSIERMCDRLARNPMLGHLRQDVADDRHRFRLAYSYLIVYRWAEKPLQVVRVLHAARDLQAILGLTIEQ